MTSNGHVDDTVHLSYRLTDDVNEATVAQMMAALSNEERARHDRFHFARDRRTRLTFNRSHTNGLVACAVGHEVDIGVDVEEVGRVDDELALAERFFSRNEAAALAACDRAVRSTRFTEVWTLKEAFIKATGEGLLCPLDRFWFAFGPEASLSFGAQVSATHEQLCFALFAPTPRHRMAIAIGTSGSRLPAVIARAVSTDGSLAAPLAPLRTAVATRSVPARFAGR